MAVRTIAVVAGAALVVIGIGFGVFAIVSALTPVSGSREQAA